jgi:hypothetical protein
MRLLESFSREVFSEKLGKMAGEFISELKKWAAELARRSGEGNEIGLNRAVELISSTFSVRPHEVAISRSPQTSVSFSFWCPKRCAEWVKYRRPARTRSPLALSARSAP